MQTQKTVKRVDITGEAISSVTFPSLAGDYPKPESDPGDIKICIVTMDVVGPVKNGGIGTAYYYAARSLAQHGFDVTILFTIQSCVDRTLEYWKEYYAKYGVNFVVVDEPEIPLARGLINDSMRLNYRVLEWLKKHDYFDFIHASEWNANVFYCLQAKRMGLHFQKTQFVIKCSSPTLWNHIGNAEPIASVEVLSRMYIERRSVELADHVICGSHYLLNWMSDQGYKLPPDKCYCQPNIFPVDDVVEENYAEFRKADELVFFGRLEPRKGIHIFVEALISMHSDGLFEEAGIPAVTFLGKPRKTFDITPLLIRLENVTGIKPVLLSDKNQPEALNYLSDEKMNRIAVMPSLMDNSPFGVYECLSRKISFITSTAGGGKELIDSGFHEALLFAPKPTSLKRVLKNIIISGCPVARASFDFGQNVEEWMDWHHYTYDYFQKRSKIEVEISKPLVSVCMAHYQRGNLLLNALDSLKNQTYDNFEVVVVDDGSTDRETLVILEKIQEQEVGIGKVKVIYQENGYLGKVRNTGIENSSGEYLLFMDDDNEAKPYEIETFVKCALHSKARILTCMSEVFSGERPRNSSTPIRRIGFQGGNIALGLLRNGYGDSNCFVEREAMSILGGFTEHYKVGKDDMEFFTRASMSGFEVQHIPVALYYYRINENRMRDNQYSTYAGYVRVLEAYTQTLPADIANILRYAQGANFVYGSEGMPRKNTGYLGKIVRKLFGRPMKLVIVQIRKLIKKYGIENRVRVFLLTHPRWYGLADWLNNKIYK